MKARKLLESGVLQPDRRVGAKGQIGRWATLAKFFLPCEPKLSPPGVSLALSTERGWSAEPLATSACGVSPSNLSAPPHLASTNQPRAGWHHNAVPCVRLRNNFVVAMNDGWSGQPRCCHFPGMLRTSCAAHWTGDHPPAFIEITSQSTTRPGLHEAFEHATTRP
jgi:hypothetical protein